MRHWQAVAYRKQLEFSAALLADDAAVESIWMFPEWTPESHYVGERVRYNDVLYECVQAHMPIPSWTPDVTPALWKVVSTEEWPEWIQPLGSVDAYRVGAKVSHNGKHWVSDIDYNTYAPGVYGWEEQT